MKKKIITILLLITLTSLSIISLIQSQRPLYSGSISSYLARVSDTLLIEGSYRAYMDHHQDKNIIFDDIVTVNIFDIDLDQTSMVYHQLNSTLITDEQGIITWRFDVDTPGLYNLRIEYYQIVEIESLGITGKSSAIERQILINGEVPFTEFERIRLSRIWEDQTEILEDRFGNQIRPRQVEKVRLVNHFVDDYEKYEVDPYYVYLETGNHTLSFESIREPLQIKSISFIGLPRVKTYQEMKAVYEEKNYQIVEDAKLTVQAEHMFEKNSPTMIPLADTSSFLSYPKFQGRRTVLNVMGIYSWRLPGYWVSYQLEVPESGLYALNFRMKQDIKQGSFVSRQITIDGVVPFKEASYLPFSYNSSFNNYVIGTPDEPYLFYLESGVREIKFQISLGNVGDAVNQVSQSINRLNQLYLSIIMYTTVNPQPYRDYQLERNILNLKSILITEYERLTEVINSYKEISSSSAAQTSILSNMSIQLERFIKDPELIVRELTSMESNISALGTWIMQESEQPLTLDHFSFFDPNLKLERGKDNIFESILHEFRRFFFSFFQDNDAFGGGGDGETIRVWVTAGRDNAQILRRLIDDYFDEDINIDLELVSRDVLLRATVSNRGPDVALMIAEGTPIDFAFRNAAYDLTQFSDFDMVANRFYESALTPFKYLDGVYALPEQQTFPVFFYRTDIFNNLSLTVPETWTEVYQLLTQLNTANLDFFVDSGSTSLATAANNTVYAGLFGTLLYQHGGAFYLNDGRQTGLLTPQAKEAFRMFTELFTSYGVPTQANFVNRFRSGEIAAGIMDYSIYNTLVVFAPEISGKWAIATVPGMDTEHQMVTSNVPFASMMLKDTKSPEASWAFLKWWTSTETQIQYARELETIMGAAARYPTANKEALAQLSWPARDLTIILEMMSRSKGIPQVPGGYMTTRMYTYAFLAVVNDGYNPLEVMNEYAREIDREIRSKREEFNLD